MRLDAAFGDVPAHVSETLQVHGTLMHALQARVGALDVALFMHQLGMGVGIETRAGHFADRTNTDPEIQAPIRALPGPQNSGYMLRTSPESRPSAKR